MLQVVQAVCPGCKKSLRIPAHWVGQALRCKHCGLVMQSRSRPVAVARPVAVPVGRPVGAPPAPRTNGAVAFADRTASVAAAPTAAALPTAPAAPFGDLDFGTPATPRRRRSGGSLWKGALLVVCILGVAVAAAVFGRPYLDRWVGGPGLVVAPPDTHPENPPQLALDTPKPRKPADDLPAKPPADDPGKKPPATEAGPKPPDPVKPMPKPPDPVRPTAKEPPPPDKPMPKPPSDLPKLAGAFPRRALFVSVNNYLYFSPTNYGKPGKNSGNLRSLQDRLNRGLKIPMNQMLELSDAAPDQLARPTLLPVVKQTITDFLDSSRPQDRLVVMFIGHAVEMGDEVFLVPVEGEQDVKETLLPLAWLYDKLKECKARQKVLVLDVCRFNPTRGLERPGSGPVEDAKVPGAMGPKLDAMLQKPPEGVQVWSACVGEQHSLEYDDLNLNNGVFQEALFNALRDLEDKLQDPEDPLPLPRLAEAVNARMKAFLDPFKKVQVSRLSGEEPKDGAAYEPKEAAAPLPEIKVPASATRKQVDDILKEVDVPALKIVKAESGLSARSMPLFGKDVLDQYLPEEPNTDFRKAVVKARQALHDGVLKLHIQEQYPVPPNPMQLKEQIKNYQMKELAAGQSELIDAMDELRAAGAPEKRALETSKRWLANYDYLLARLEAQVAYLYEYQSTLGSMRKDLPPHDPAVHNGWRLASQSNLTGDSAGKKLAASSKKGLEKIAKDYPGTPWEVLAKRDRLTALGLEWQAAKLE